MSFTLHPPLSSKQAYIDALQFGIGVVTFTKKDGTERAMASTLSDHYMPTTEKRVAPNGEALSPKVKENPDVLKVFDIEAEAWRSFRLDSVISFELQSGGNE